MVRTTAIVAAYNEEGTIADVLRALASSPIISEIIVVSDGSTDRTVEIARTFDVTTIALRENRGKGFAMRVGVEHATHDVLFFCDGDMYNVTGEQIAALVEPVVRDECDMNIGVRNRGDVLNFMHLRMQCGPVLSGIRVMRREVWETVPAQYMERFKIEAALNCFCAQSGLRQKHTIVYGLNHVLKESKRGLVHGLISRWKMTREVFLIIFDLYVFETWRWAGEPDDMPVPEFELFDPPR